MGLILSLRPTTIRLGPRLRITPRKVAEEAGGKTAEPGGRSRRTNKGRGVHCPSHASCGGRRVNRELNSRADPPAPTPAVARRRRMWEGRAARPRVGTFFRAPGGGGERAARARCRRRRGDRPESIGSRPAPVPVAPSPVALRGCFSLLPGCRRRLSAPPLLASWVSLALPPPLPLRSV